jgi:hypothetical protein
VQRDRKKAINFPWLRKSYGELRMAGLRTGLNILKLPRQGVFGVLAKGIDFTTKRTMAENPLRELDEM